MSDIINTVIIDDEQNFIYSLEILLKKNFPNINIIGKASTVAEAESLLKLANPVLVFLDINLPDGTAFDLLEKLPNHNFEIIFTTAYTEFAFKAFEFSALHYLMKPMTIEKLQEAIERFLKIRNSENLDEKLLVLKESLVKKPQKILLPSSDGISVFNISDILRCEADNNYAFVYFINKQKILVSKPLQSLDKILNDLDFVRIHSKHLINLRYVKKYVTGRKPYVILTDNTELPISQTQKSEFADRLKQFAKAF